MALEGSTTDERATLEDEGMKDEETTSHEHRSEELGAVYLLCKSEPWVVHPMSQPHPSQNLLSLYGLDSLAATVARTDPVTGEKINKMRKSYEGKIKSFNLAGRNKAVKHEEGRRGGLMEIVQWPEEEWHNQKVLGKEVEKGLGDGMLAKLDRAMKMEPGLVPNNEAWEDILGHEKAKPIPSPAELATKKPLPHTTNYVKPNGQNNVAQSGNTSGTPSAEVARPKRSGRKRRYDEHSFEGYGEGYVDDDGEVGGGGYSSGEGEGSRRGGSSKKKRKTEYATTRPPGFGDRAGSYGVGMVGVGSGIGAYGR
ncbi:MAG: hypothetical protein M1830_002999 [Pleopsidium flavum]|nr:MAG: hypothetical protein M1830_002999 [Pleopsidium flavum]